MSRLKSLLKFFGGVLLILTVAFLYWATKDILELKNSTEKGWFAPPTKFYTAPTKIYNQQSLNSSELSQLLKRSGFKERGQAESLSQNEFTFTPAIDCNKMSKLELSPNTSTCFFIINENNESLLVEMSYEKVEALYLVKDTNTLPINYFLIPPFLFTQVLNGSHILRTYSPLSHIPRYCLDAVLAIEDSRFLNHGGISLRGILRAALTNLKSGRYSQGGSTLTQQLIKNKFLTNKKTFSRKIKEAWLSILLELVLTKNQILEAYLNYIYWGQSGSFSVHGIQESAHHYFQKDVKKLNLTECALLAGAIKSPGLYGPHTSKSQQRKQDVLDRMLELNLILESDYKLASEAEVYVNISSAKVQAPYYVDAALNELKNLTHETKIQGLNVYTELDIFSQRVLDSTMDSYLKNRSEGFQGSFIIGDNELNSVVAISNGLSRSVNFNAAVYGKRQVGSLAKPFVYLTALEELPELTPFTSLSNAPLTYEYEGQKWNPKNYSTKESEDFYPVHIALAKSINIPTTRLMQKFGYRKVYNNLIKHGFEKFKPITPSLALGSFEASPHEVLLAYINLTRQTPFTTTPRFLRKVTNIEDSTLYSRELPSLNPEPLSKSKLTLLNMMKETLKIGTARAASRLNLKGFYSAKTGTTNDHKDGWFAATNKNYTYVVWVGKAPYLTDTGRKITGSSAALPIWMSAIKKLEKYNRTRFEPWVEDNTQEYKDKEHPF